VPELGGDHRNRLVSGRGSYLADLPFDGVEAAFVRSPYAHAAFDNVSLPPGAGAAAADLGLRTLRVDGPGLVPCPWDPLPQGRARYVGEPVAVVWAADRYEAEDLADQVEVDFEPLTDGQPLHDTAPDGVLFRLAFENGPLEESFAQAARVFEGRFKAARQAPLPLECRGVVARPIGDRLEVTTSTQIPDLVKTAVVQALGMEEGSVRVMVPDVGGGFGLKASVFAEEIVVAALARKLGRAVRWVEDRRENLYASAHAHDTSVHVRVAVDGDGVVLAADAEVVADVGAYSIHPFSCSLEVATAANALFAPYRLRAVRLRGRAVASSRCPVGAYRGVGTVVAVHATERMLDVVARELGLDPLEIRRRNLHQRLPVTTVSDRRLDSGDYAGLLSRLEAVSGYGALRAQQAEARAQGRLVGLGIALFNEHSGTGATDYRMRGVNIEAYDASRVRVFEDGTIQISTSAAEAGQGHAETYRALAGRELGVRPEQVAVVEGDTDLCPPGTGSYASRGAVGVVQSLVEALRAAAEQDLAPGTDVVRTVDATQVYPSGAHLALVEVDPGSFKPRVLRYVAVEDCGTILNPQVVEGQVRGGVAMGLGDVLLGEQVYSDEGQNLTSSLLDYLVPLASDVPEVEIEHVDSSTPATVLGSKGVGEAGTIGAYGAITNAVADAVAPLGAVLTDLPYSPRRIYAAVTASSRLSTDAGSSSRSL
jgi:carbon-monoxide dehydrogenase large subunit